MTVIDAERFSSGLTWEQYLADSTKSVERRQEIYNLVSLTPQQQADLDRLKSTGLQVLVLEEDWCGDAVRSGPIMAHLADAAGITARWFKRDQNLDLMDQHLEDGRARAIPCFVFMDAQFNYLGRWGSRPKRIKEMRAKAMAGFPPKDDPGYNDAVLAMRQASREAYDQDYPGAIVTELLDTIAKAVSKK